MIWGPSPAARKPTAVAARANVRKTGRDAGILRVASIAAPAEIPKRSPAGKKTSWRECGNSLPGAATAHADATVRPAANAAERLCVGLKRGDASNATMEDASSHAKNVLLPHPSSDIRSSAAGACAQENVRAPAYRMLSRM